MYIALLRAVNVGGHNMIRMADLKLLCERLGYGNVRTFIQSGNVLFTDDAPPSSLAAQIQAEILTAFGLTIPVVIRTPAELATVVAGNPYMLADGESLHVAFLAEAPAPDAAERLAAISAPPDECRLVGSHVYLLYRQPSHKSKLTNQLIEQKLGVSATARNWQTIQKLIALAASQA